MKTKSNKEKKTVVKKNVTTNGKNKTIRTGILVSVLPIVAIAMSLLMLVSYEYSNKVVIEQIEANVASELSGQTEMIKSSIQLLTSTSSSLSNTGTYMSKINAITSLEASTVKQTDRILKVGLLYNMGDLGATCAKRDGNLVVLDKYQDDFRDSEMFQKSQENKNTFIMPLQKNEDGLYSVKAVTQIQGMNYKPIGCAVAELDISYIADSVNNISIGDNGYAVLIENDGSVIAGDSLGYVTGDSIETEIFNVFTEDKGVYSGIVNSEECEVFYTKIEDTGWILAVFVPVTQIKAPMQNMLMILSVITLIGIILSVIAVSIIANLIGRDAKKVQNLAKALSEGDYTVKELKLTRKDELGQIADALNQMYVATKGMLSVILTKSDEIRNYADQLNDSMGDIKHSFGEVADSIDAVKDDMQDVSRSTESVNGASAKVTSALASLANKTEECLAITEELKANSIIIQDNANKSSSEAQNIAAERERELEIAIKNADVIKEIGNLTNTIDMIAEQTKLLALNASIEAARAGVTGKGFAVVASEVSNLAEQTSTAVEEIQNIVSAIEQSFDEVKTCSEGLLEFVNETVKPDYDKFVDTAEQYGTYANTLSNINELINTMTISIGNSVNEVANSIDSITQSTISTTDRSHNTADSMNKAEKVADQVFELIQNQNKISIDLQKITSSFKL